MQENLCSEGDGKGFSWFDYTPRADMMLGPKSGQTA